MTTAVLTRPPAAPEPDRHWATRGACTPTTGDSFYGTGPTKRAGARKVCRSCPVLARCLEERPPADGGGDPWSVVGGLDAQQRQALDVAARIGEHPDLTVAQQLLTPRWRYRLHSLRTSAAGPDRIAQRLRTEGLEADAITVRVAIWWSGGAGKAIGRRSPGDPRHLWRRLADDHARTIERLRAAGASHTDVATYFAVPRSTCSRAIRAVEGLQDA